VAIYISYLNILDYHGFYRNLVMTCYWVMLIQTGFRVGARHDTIYFFLSLRTKCGNLPPLYKHSRLPRFLPKPRNDMLL
ncbi:uncharacterized protein METZ01_LOCUS238167, partial [marine metagenome]